MTDRAIIVSAADHAYWPYLSGLLNSIDKRRRVAGIAVGIFDLGLSHEQLSELTSYGAVVATPGWDYDISGFDKPPAPTFRAMTARPTCQDTFQDMRTMSGSMLIAGYRTGNASRR